jgi:hypothetical protein
VVLLLLLGFGWHGDRCAKVSWMSVVSVLPYHAYDKHDSATPTKRTGSVAKLHHATARSEFTFDNRFYRDDQLPGEGVFMLRATTN